MACVLSRLANQGNNVNLLYILPRRSDLNKGSVLTSFKMLYVSSTNLSTKYQRFPILWNQQLSTANVVIPGRNLEICP